MTYINELEHSASIQELCDFDLSLLPDCPRHMTNVARDLDKIAGKSNEEIDALGIPRYYASELIGIKQGEYPSVDVLQKKYEEMDAVQAAKFSEFMSNFMRLREGGDVCDKEGIKYIAGFFYLYRPGSSQFHAISKTAQDFISYELSADYKVFKLAKILVDAKSKAE